MKAGDIFLSERSYYIVVDDYSILRPLILTKADAYNFHFQSTSKYGIPVGEAKDKNGFYEGDKFITDNLYAFMAMERMGVASGN